MGTDVKQIVQISITDALSGVSAVGMGTPMIVGEGMSFADGIRYRVYTDLAGMAADLTNGVAAIEYKMANAMWSQTIKPVYIALGKVEAGDVDYTAALNAISNVNNDWYGLLCDSKAVAIQNLVAAWGLANGKQTALATSDANTVGQDYAGDTTSIGKLREQASDKKVAIFYTDDATTNFPDAGYIGYLLPLTPGSYTGMFKKLAGVTIDTLTPTEALNAHNKRVNTYETVGTLNMVVGGYNSDGFTDDAIFIDWLQNNIRTEVFSVLSRSKKVPGSDAGIASIEGAVRKVLKLGIDNGGITPISFDADGVQNGGFITTVPLNADRLASDKTDRILRDVNFKCWIAGAIHTIIIEGVVTN